jgi:photosystem II stability/assembly factor-like uncharacterized protein
MATTNDRILIGTRKGLFEARRADAGWSLDRPALGGEPIAYATRDPRSGSIWASIDHGHWGVKLSRSRADDGTYEEVDAPKYAEATGKSATYYWVLQPGHADRPKTFYVGTNPGALFQSDDDGATWAMNEPLWKMCAEHKWTGGGRDDAGIHSICINPNDPDHIYIAVSCAGVVETRDGGKSWTYVNKGLRMDYAPPDQQDVEYGHDPHCVVISPSDPSVLWQANHCGVYRTSNGAEHWEEVSQKPLIYFGFPLAVHPQQADTAWLVPMHSDDDRVTVDGHLRVMRTDDAGKTWTTQDTGLPQQNAWDFPYRHALDVAPDGETLVLGTTSGNLYVSGDGGASWETLSNNLPLIYSARFA